MSNNPFSVPDSPPALIDSPKSRRKKVLHVLAFALILVIWYSGAFTWANNKFDSIYQSHGRATEIFLGGNKFVWCNQFAIYAIEALFVCLLVATICRRSFRVTLSLLAFSVLWTFLNGFYTAITQE